MSTQESWLQSQDIDNAKVLGSTMVLCSLTAWFAESFNESQR